MIKSRNSRKTGRIPADAAAVSRPSKKQKLPSPTRLVSAEALSRLQAFPFLNRLGGDGQGIVILNWLSSALCIESLDKITHRDLQATFKSKEEMMIRWASQVTCKSQVLPCLISRHNKPVYLSQINVLRETREHLFLRQDLHETLRERMQDSSTNSPVAALALDPRRASSGVASSSLPN